MFTPTESLGLPVETQAHTVSAKAGSEEQAKEQGVGSEVCG